MEPRLGSARAASSDGQLGDLGAVVGASRSRRGALLGPFRVLLGALLGALWALLGVHRSILGPSWRQWVEGGGLRVGVPLRSQRNQLLESSWGDSGPPWGPIGSSWRHLGAAEAHRKRARRDPA